MHKTNSLTKIKTKKTGRKLFKRLLPIFMIIPLLITSTFHPSNKANAAIAIPLGLGAGAGLYVVGGLAVAGLATVVGLEHGDAIREHSLNVWDGATTTVKDSVNWSLEQWQTLQNNILPIGDALSTYIEHSIPSLTANILSDIYGVDTTDPKYSFTVSGTYIYPNTQSPLVISFNNTVVSDASIKHITHLQPNGFRTIQVVGYSASGQSVTTSLEFQQSVDPYERLAQMIQAEDIFSLVSITSTFGITNGQLSITSAPNITATPNELDFANAYNSGVSSTREAWQDMKDAGLVLPNTGVTTYTGDTLVNYDAQSGQYVGIDGNVYNPADLTWKFPTIRTRTATADIPAGTYVDSPALTGNPAIDQALIGNPAIPKTTTNVSTGVTYANPDITANPTDPTNPTKPDKPSYNIFKILFDLIKAILNLLKSYWLFFLLLPAIPEKKIPFEMFQLFKTFTPFGFPIYSTVQALALFTSTFLLIRVIRRLRS